MGVGGENRAFTDCILLASLSAFFLLRMPRRCARRVAGLSCLLLPCSASNSSSASISLAAGVWPRGRGGRSRLPPCRCCSEGSSSSSASASLREGVWPCIGDSGGCPDKGRQEGRERERSHCKDIMTCLSCIIHLQPLYLQQPWKGKSRQQYIFNPAGQSGRSG